MVKRGMTVYFYTGFLVVTYYLINNQIPRLFY